MDEKKQVFICMKHICMHFLVQNLNAWFGHQEINPYPQKNLIYMKYKILQEINSSIKFIILKI